MSQNHFNGYTLAYERDEIQFPVYVVALIGAGFTAAAIAFDNVFLFGLALCAFGFAYYNYPLLETGRPRLGAGQYGIFVEGLGIISWRAIKQIDLVAINLRGAANNELRITLQEPLEDRKSVV